MIVCTILNPREGTSACRRGSKTIHQGGEEVRCSSSQMKPNPNKGYKECA